MESLERGMKHAGDDQWAKEGELCVHCCVCVRPLLSSLGPFLLFHPLSWLVPLGKYWRRPVAPFDLTIDKGAIPDL